jgi:hypothetical protein
MSNGRYLYEKATQSILIWLHMAEDDLVGHLLVTSSGETGTCRAICLDDDHGLCFTFDEIADGPRRWMPVSTIKTHGPKS